MGVAASKVEFEKAAKGLPFYDGLDMAAEVVCVEPIDAEYFRNSTKQRCIIRRTNGRLYVANYD